MAAASQDTVTGPGEGEAAPNRLMRQEFHVLSLFQAL